MTKERYDQIKTNKDFLFIYFKEESKSNIDKQTFDNSFQMWLMIMAHGNIGVGISTIVKYLDSINRT